MASVQPRCSIIIPVYNWASLTRQILECLLAQPPAVPAEIIVVDDGSRDLTPRLLAGYGGKIRVVTHAANQGYASACNDGAAVAAGEYLVLLNNDTLPRAGWLDALVRHADAHPKSAVVGSKMVRPDGTVECTGVVMGRLLGGDENVPLPLYYGLSADHPAVNKSRRFQMVTGACMLVRRSAFEAAGGLDRAFVNGREDVDLCLRLGEMGHEMRYCHESEVAHLGSMTRWSQQVMDDPLGDIRNGVALFQQRWGKRTERDDIRYFVEDGLLSVGYVAPYRLRVDVAPELGTLGSGEYEQRSDRLIERYAWRTFHLMREKHRLQVRLAEDELRALASTTAGAEPIASSWHDWLRNTSVAARHEMVAAMYLRGHGIEIEARYDPLSVPAWVEVSYVDRLTVEELRRAHPERQETPVQPDILDDGERLERVADASQDFVIATHFLAGCADLSAAVATFLRVLESAGIAFLVMPDRRYAEASALLAAALGGTESDFDVELTLRNADERLVILRKKA